MCEIKISKEQARAIALDIYDALVRDINVAEEEKQQETSVSEQDRKAPAGARKGCAA